MKFKVAVVIGSLRKESFSRKMDQALIKIQPENLNLEIVEIGALQMYNQDLDESAPKEWTEFRQQIKAADAVLFITPEYNRSVPAVLKNAIDVGSIPYGHSAWNEKPAAIISLSPGAMGAFGANHHLRQSLVFLNMPILQQPEAYIGGAAKLFGAGGEITNESTAQFLAKFLQAYADWIGKFVRGKL
jgi:chromate reductase